MAANDKLSVPDLLRQYLLSALASTGIGGPGSQNVTVTNTAGPGNIPVDVQDRAARLLGHTTVDNLTADQLVHGTVAVSNPTANPETGLAKDATLTGGTQTTKIVNGANTLAISSGGNVYTSDTFTKKIGEGKARIGGAIVTTTAIATSAYLSVENPVGNTRVVYVVGFDMYIDTGSATIQYRSGGTTPNPSVGALFNPNLAVSSPSTAIIHAGTTAPTGFTTQPLNSRLTTAGLKIQQLVVLPPGAVFGLMAVGAAVGANITGNVFLYEE